MPTIPDPDYLHRRVFMEELIQKKYKERVGQESQGKDYRKFAQRPEDLRYVLLENIRKARSLLGEDIEEGQGWREVNHSALLEKQLACLREDFLYVLCTCVLFVYDFNPEFLR